MEKLILMMSIICFIFSFWWVIAEVDGHFGFKIIFKSLAIIGCTLPIILWLKYLHII